jgi:hypothetical protein
MTMTHGCAVSRVVFCGPEVCAMALIDGYSP